MEEDRRQFLHYLGFVFMFDTGMKYISADFDWMFCEWIAGEGT